MKKEVKNPNRELLAAIDSLQIYGGIQVSGPDAINGQCNCKCVGDKCTGNEKCNCICVGGECNYVGTGCLPSQLSCPSK